MLIMTHCGAVVGCSTLLQGADHLDVILKAKRAAASPSRTHLHCEVAEAAPPMVRDGPQGHACHSEQHHQHIC
jgi:hypothetical protein